MLPSDLELWAPGQPEHVMDDGYCVSVLKTQGQGTKLNDRFTCNTIGF